MVGKTHVVIGLTTLVITNVATDFVQPHPIEDMPTGPILCIGAVILGALLPDLDAEDSQIQHEFGQVGLALSNWLQVCGIEHRGLTHYGVTTLAVVVISCLLGWWSGYLDVGLAFGLGYISHVLADSLTIAGTPLLWPLVKENRFHLVPAAMRVRTGGPIEAVIFIIVTIILVLLLPTLLPTEVTKNLHHWFY